MDIREYLSFCRYLGQMLDGPEAQQALRKGIEIIRKELQGVVSRLSNTASGGPPFASP